MPVQMIGSEIEEQTDIRAEILNKLELEAAQFHDCDGVVRHTLDAGNQRSPNIARENGGN